MDDIYRFETYASIPYSQRRRLLPERKQPFFSCIASSKQSPSGTKNAVETALHDQSFSRSCGGTAS
jgi:hypothetical protein